MAVSSPPSPNRTSNSTGLISLPVIVAALGYFVDIYDLLLFGIVRVPSLKDLGLTPEQISTVGASIINWQMGGLLLGGILWGVLGDKRGRLSVLFGSIITYSIANIACGFIKQVTFMDPTTYYALMRFIAGIGLAGELGAGITLVSEILPKEKRAIGTSLVAGIGLFGAVVAYFTVQLFDWQMAFLVGGGLGIGLLLLRVGVVESGMFTDVTAQKHVNRGDFFSFFTNAERFFRYLRCIGIGLPTWFVIGILATFSNEFGKALGITEEIQPGLAIMWCYVGLAVGDLASGFISQALASRKKGRCPAHAYFTGVQSGVSVCRRTKCNVPLYSLPHSGIWHRVLGHVRHHRGRAVRYQPPRYGGYHHTEYGAGHGYSDDQSVRIPEAVPGPHQCRSRCGFALFYHWVLLHPDHRRNAREGLELPGRIAQTAYHRGKPLLHNHSGRRPNPHH